MKLEKVNNRLYHEVDDKGDDPWLKAFERLRMSLTDIRVLEGINIEIKNEVLGMDENLLSDSRMIFAKGSFHPQTVCLINPDEGETASFDEASISIYPTTKWDETAEGPTFQEVANIPTDDDADDDWDPGRTLGRAAEAKFATKPGYLMHQADEYVGDKTHLDFELYIPEQKFNQIWQRLMTSRDIENGSLTVRVEVFQSEFIRRHREHHHPRAYYIESKSFHNWAFLTSLSVFTTPTPPTAEEPEELDDESPPDSDRTGKTLTTTLLAVMETLKSLRTALYIIIVLLLAVIVAVLL